MTLLNTWPIAAYAPLIKGADALKLSDSEIAPLVAVAGGLMSADTINAATVATSLGMSIDKRNAVFKQFTAHMNPTVLAMPWYSFETVTTAQRMAAAGANVSPQCNSPQWRPAQSFTSHDNRIVKYEFGIGMGTTIGIHPATPSEWIADAPTVLIAEGMLKGYSAITAWLVAAGVSATDLSISPTDTADIARTRLLALSKDAAERTEPVLVVILPGVGNWHNKAEWNSMPVKGRNILVAFDGDLGENINVWNQGDQLRSWFSGERKASSVSFLDPSVDGTSKSGIDDYLATGKTLADLLNTASDTMPPRPTPPTPTGTVRMNDATRCMEKLIEDENGSQHWTMVYPMSGRISSLFVPKEATWDTKEMRSGNADPSNAARGMITEAEFEIAELIDPDCGLGDEPIDEHNPAKRLSIAVARGPHELAATPPERWGGREGTIINPRITTSPNWPPKMEWLSALKGHRRPDIVQRNVWQHMGYVPTNDTDTMPVFISGMSVITTNGVQGADSPLATPGVTRQERTNAEQYGANEPRDANGKIITSGEPYRAAIRDAIETLISTYTNGSWTDDRIPAVVIGASLRAAVPTRPKLSIFLYGPSQVGKTWTAERMLAFWSAKPGQLQPGTARDTYLATEIALSQTMLHVSDDLAPSQDKTTADRAEGTLGEMIRNHFNGTQRARGTSGMRLARSHTPRAVFIVTSENPFSGESQMNRALVIRTKRGYLSNSTIPTDAVRTLCQTTNTANIVATALVRFLLNEAQDRTLDSHHDGLWSQYIDEWQDFGDSSAVNVRSTVSTTGSDAERVADISRDPLMGIEALGLMANWAQCDDATMGMLATFNSKVVRYAADNFADAKSSTLGSRLISALSALLGQGKVHITGLDGEPPVTGSATSRYSGSEVWWNQAVGWRYSAEQGWTIPSGSVSIGQAIWRDNEVIILFDPTNAFLQVSMHMQHLIQPGTKAESAWTAARSEGKTFDGGWAMRGRSATVRVQRDGHSLLGVPVLLDLLLDQTPILADEDDTTQ